jgi:tetratricopeptide (TPR) repeat protein
MRHFIELVPWNPLSAQRPFPVAALCSAPGGGYPRRRIKATGFFMKRNATFWMGMAVFQLFFGLAVFGMTRAYYLDEDRGMQNRALMPAQPGALSAEDIALGSALRMSAANDPQAMAREADVFFGERQYAQAAEIYARLLELNPDNVETRNNLGLTLHYLGRHEEALRELRTGAEKNPDHQRIWLTLGFVNSQLGNVEEARAALTRAAASDDNPNIRESAQEMLDALPPEPR